MYRSISVVDFLGSIEESVVLDVRSEGEFEQGHLAGSINLPLLNNEERSIVGTIYKKEGNQAAVLKGFELTGGKFATYISKASELAKGKTISLYCWRGGMRSNIMAWLLTTAGLEVQLLQGGYKAYRRYVLEELNQERKFKILGGKTGTGKSHVLRAMQKMGVQVIDLERLANHRGSAYGGIGLGKQPSVEQFENDLFEALSKFTSDKLIWLENESRLIGKIKLPDIFYAQMRTAEVVELVVSSERRAKLIVEEYGIYPKAELAEITRSIEKKLGNLRMKQALELLEQSDMINWAMLLLSYYDNFYEYGMSLRLKETITEYEVNTEDYEEIAKALVEKFDRMEKLNEANYGRN